MLIPEQLLKDFLFFLYFFFITILIHMIFRIGEPYDMNISSLGIQTQIRVFHVESSASVRVYLFPQMELMVVFLIGHFIW